MGKLESIYPIAIENTKEKIIQDIEFYLENQEDNAHIQHIYQTGRLLLSKFGLMFG